MADDRTAGPMTMYRSGKGRCGEESTFTVTALRSVGLAARQVYTPRWAHCDDNHAWVEVWVNGEWHFLGAASRKKNWIAAGLQDCRTGAFDSQPHIRRLCGGKAGRGNRQGRARLSATMSPLPIQRHASSGFRCENRTTPRQRTHKFRWKF